ncbi:MAG: pyridoxamine 5'-phosphate oxidase family protein [Acetobacteraceae bacterium]
MDAIVLARCGFNHSVNYRSAMAYGKAYVVEDEAEKLAAMDSFVDRYFPGRSKLLRPASKQEIKATTFVGMEMEQASGKIRNEPVHDDEADYAVPAWDRAAADPHGPGRGGGMPPPDGRGDAAGGMAGYVAGRRLDEVMLETYRQLYGEEG